MTFMTDPEPITRLNAARSGAPLKETRVPNLQSVLSQEIKRLAHREIRSELEALLKRKVKLHGDFLLGLKLHLILG